MSQSRKDVMAALVEVLKANTTGFNLIEDAVKHPDELSAGNYPACLLVDAGTTVSHAVTSTTDIVLDVFIKIYGDVDTSVDDMRDLDEEILDVFTTQDAVRLDGACLWCLPHASDVPLMWSDTHKFMTRRYVVTYRRD